MGPGSILFVHGTGVRLKAYQKTYVAACNRATQHGIPHTMVECEWGDGLGIDLPTLSLPRTADDPPAPPEAVDQQWSYLDVDPFFELRLLAAAPVAGATPTVSQLQFGAPKERPAHEVFWETVTTKPISLELETLLERAHALEEWPAVWGLIVMQSDIARQAVYASGDETADAAMALARALSAAVSQRVQARGWPAPGASFRDRLVDRLRVDWGQQVFALSGRIKGFFTGLLRERRREWSERMSPELGDILLYQANGTRIRAFIRKKIARLDPPVYLLAHSLGGIACVDLLAMRNPPRVEGLITVGSQAPLLYEIGALRSLKRHQQLPSTFPKWLNLYDPNDFLSYVAEGLFGKARVNDVAVLSGELPLAAHSAYWNCDETWQAIEAFTRP